MESGDVTRNNMETGVVSAPRETPVRPSPRLRRGPVHRPIYECFPSPLLTFDCLLTLHLPSYLSFPYLLTLTYLLPLSYFALSPHLHTTKFTLGKEGPKRSPETGSRRPE